MRRLSETLTLILKAERQAEALRRRYGPEAEARMRRGAANASRERLAYRRLVERALRGRAPVPRTARVSRPALFGLAGLALVLVGAGVANAAIGSAVTKGAQACLPLLSGAAPSDLTADAGLRQVDGAWAVTDGASTVEMAPPGRANPDVCALYIPHAAGEEQAIYQAVDAWAAGPDLNLSRTVQQEAAAQGERLTSAWRGAHDDRELEVVLSKDLGAGADGDLQSMLLITAR